LCIIGSWAVGRMGWERQIRAFARGRQFLLLELKWLKRILPGLLPELRASLRQKENSPSLLGL